MKNKILNRNKNLYESYDEVTYLSPSVYDKVLKSKDLKYVWCYAKALDKKMSLNYLLSLAPDYDPASKKWLDYGLGKNTLTTDPDYRPSVDKKNPNLGYVEGNIQILSLRTNRIKNDSSKEELKSIVENVKWESD